MRHFGLFIKTLIFVLLFSSFAHAKVEKINLFQRQIEQMDRAEMALYKKAIEFLDKNPKHISEIMDPREYRQLRHAVLNDSFDEYIAKQKPRSMYIRGAEGQRERVMLNPTYINFVDFAYNLKASNDQEQIVRLYTRLYQTLPLKYRNLAERPRTVQRSNLRMAQSYLDRLMNLIGRIDWSSIGDGDDDDQDDRPVGWVFDCSKEIGTNPNTPITRGDRARRCQDSQFHSTSLFKNSSFPLKYYHTCIRSQGSRGTCVSFAINSILASHLMLKTDDAYNFSEQFTYFYGSFHSRGSGRYSYGLSTARTLDKFVDERVKFEFERFWKYNRSEGIADEKDSNNQYANSCDDYNGQMCTGFAFQSEEDISGPWWNRTRTYTVPYRGTNETHRLRGTNTLKGFWTSSSSALDSAISLLRDGEPVIVSFDVQQNFRDTTRNGIVRYESSSADKGGHASVLLGFIYNSELPSGFPRAKEKGYFILKNSWGNWAGDCGYYYVDYEYLEENLKNLYTVSI